MTIESDVEVLHKQTDNLNRVLDRIQAVLAGPTPNLVFVTEPTQLSGLTARVDRLAGKLSVALATAEQIESMLTDHDVAVQEARTA